MELILYDKPAYTKEEYKAIRKYNRSVAFVDLEAYCRKQIDWSPWYTICVDGVEYVMDNWYKGIIYLRKVYKVDLFKFPSFGVVFALGRKLPENIQYVSQIKETFYASKLSYVSKEVKFETYETDETFSITPYYGEKEKIKEAIIYVSS